MSIEANLRARAAYMEKYGFAYGLGSCGGPACFLGADQGGDDKYSARTDKFLRVAIFDDQYGCFAGRELARDGWTTEDAIAALTIAADIAHEEGL